MFMTYQDDSLFPTGGRLPQVAKKEGETPGQVIGQKTIKRTRHSFYLDIEIIRSLDQTYKRTRHEVHPREISKSNFLEECMRYALSHRDEIKRNLCQTESTPETMSISALAARCIQEIADFRQGNSFTDVYCAELLRRATLQGNQEAWEILQQCLSETVREWIENHPRRTLAIGLDSEENYVAQAFVRFRHGIDRQQAQFNRLSTVLKYLQASLNGAVLDALRVSRRPGEIPQPHSAISAGPATHSESNEVWEKLKEVFSEPGELRLAYLLFHCGLSPKDIVRICPEEFNDVREIGRLRRTIIERLLPILTGTEELQCD